MAESPALRITAVFAPLASVASNAAVESTAAAVIGDGHEPYSRMSVISFTRLCFAVIRLQRSAIVTGSYLKHTGISLHHAQGTMTNQDAIELDATGLACPMPLLKAKRALNAMSVGQRLRVRSTDQGSVRDFGVFAELSGHLLLDSAEAGGVYIFLLEKR
jgi:tRNA 2-thiouridine synthesizing protein A